MSASTVTREARLKATGNKAAVSVGGSGNSMLGKRHVDPAGDTSRVDEAPRLAMPIRGSGKT